MANILEISQPKYCRFENNKTFLDWDKIPLLAETLEMNITDLFPNENKYYYFHKPTNNSGYIENQKNYDESHIAKIEALYEKLLTEKDYMYQEIIKEKDVIIEFLKTSND